MPDTNFGNPFMANMSENPVHKIVVEVRNKAVPTRADVMQSKEGTFIAVPVEYDPNKDHAYKFAGPNQKKLLKEFGENFISVTQFGSIIEGIDDTSAINKINKILKSVGIEKTITGELKAVTEDMMDSVEKEVKRLSPEYGKEIENIFRRIKNFRVADTYGNAFHRAIELLEKEGSNDPRNIEKVLKRMTREKKADKTYGNVLSDVSDGDRSRNALLKDIDAYFKKKTELGLGNIAGAEQQLGAVVKIGNEIVKIAGTFDQLFLKTNYILRDLKTSSSKQPSPAYGLQLNLLEKLLNSVGISVSERGITRVKKGEAFDYKIGKISDQDITKLISMVLDIQKEKDPSNREALQVQARSILGSGAILTRVGKRGRQTTYNDMTLGDIQKYSYLTEDQKIDLVKNLFSGMSAKDKDLFVSSLFNTNKYGKEGAVEPSNDFYRKGPFYDRLRKEIPNPYFGTASSNFGYKEFETKEGEKVGGSVYGGLFASQNAQKYRILKAKYGEAVANKFLDQMLRDIDSAIGSKTDDKTSYETAKSAESFFRSLGLVEDKTPLNQDFVKRIDELTSGYRNISEFLERERFGDLGGQLQGISKEEQALMARSSSDYRGIKETDQIFKTLASLREVGEGTGGLFDTIKKMEVDSKNIEDPKELLNKYSDILYSIFSGFSDFKDLISKSIKNLGRVSEIDEFGNYLEENKSEQILDYINDFYSNAENIIKNSQLTPEVQQNLISRLSYARSTERNGSISHQIGYRVARGVGVYDYINSILAGGLEKANIAAQEKGMVELSPEQYAAFVLSPEAFSQYSLSKKFKENYQNKKNLPQFLRDFVSDSSYDESAEFASLKKQVAEEFINPTTRMFEDTRVYINEAGNVVSGLNVVSDILGKQLSDKSGEFNLAGEFKTLENEPEWANRILRGMGVYRIEDVDKKMESLPQFYGAVFPRVSDDRKNEIEKRKKELEEEKEKLDSLVGEHGAEYSSDEYEKIADEYEKIADETEKLNDELKTLTSAESSRENLLSQIKTYLDEQNNIYNQTIQTIENNYKEVGNVSGTESHPEDFDTPEEKRDYFLKTAQENLLKRTGGLTSQMSDEELLSRLTSNGDIILNKELSNLLRKYSESQDKVGTVSGYSAEQVEMVRNMMEIAKVGYEYQQKQLEEIKKAQEEAEKLQKENEEKVNKIKERAVNSKKAYETASVEITETEDFLKPDFVEDEEKTKRSVSAKRGWETRRKKQGNLLSPAPANVTTSPVQTAQSGPIHVIIDGTVQGDFKNKKTVMETWDTDGNLISFSTKDISKRSGSPRGTPQLDVIKQIKEDTGNIVQMMASGVTAQNIQSPRMMSPGPGRSYRVKKIDDTEKQKLKNEREYQALLNKRLSILDSLLSAQKKAGITQGREKQSQLDIVEEEQKRLDDIEQRIGVASGKDMDSERKKDIEYLNSLAESTRKVKVAAKDRGNRTIFDVIKSDIQRATMRITDFGLAAKVLNTARKEIQQVYQNILKLDEAMTNLRIVTGSNTEQAKSMMNTYNDLAMQLGTTTQAVAQSAAEWLRQGYSVSEANELIKSSTYLSRLGFMDMNQSVTALTSVMKGFRIEAADSMDIVDKLTQLDAKYATTAGDIATALSRTSAVAREAGLDLDQTAAALTTMIDVSQQDASSVGNAFRTILARYGNVKATAFTSLVGDSDDIDDANGSINDTEKVLGAIGIKIRSSAGDMRDFYDVMEELAEVYPTLDEVSRNAVATALGGTRQRNLLSIMIQNWSQVKESQEEAEKAQGTAARKMQAYNESVAYSINQLSAAWEGFAQKLEASPIVKFGYKFLTVVIKNLGQILSITLSLMTALRSYKFTTDMKRLADFLGFGKNMDADSKNKKTGFSVFKMSQKAQEEEQKYTEKKNQNEFERSRSKLIRSNANVREGLDKVAVALDNNTAAQKMQNRSGFRTPSQNGLVPYGANQEIIPYVPKQEIKIKRNWWRWITGSSVVPGSVYGRKAGKLESNSEKFSSNYQYQNGLFSLNEEDFLKSQKASDMAKKYREQEIVQDAARAEELAKFGAVRKQSIITGATSGLVAGIVTGASTEGDVSDKVRAGLVSGVSTGLLSAIPGIGPIIGPILGPMLGGILDKYLLKPLLKADEIARKERVEEAKKQLEAIKEIGSSVTNIIDLNKTDQSLWDSDNWKKFNEQVETINDALDKSEDALDKSELGEKLKELGLAAGETTIRLKDYSTETLAQVEAERIRFEAEKTYAAGEQDRYTLQKEINENQKKLANLDNDEISKKKELNAAIKAAKAEIEDYSEALKKGYMQASFYSSGVGTMESYDIGNATLDRVIMQIAREWAKDSPDIFSGNQLTNDARSNIVSYLREQSGYASLFKNDTKNVGDMLTARDAVDNLRKSLNISQKQLKEFANSKDLLKIGKSFGLIKEDIIDINQLSEADKSAVYKLIDKINLVDEDGITTIAHAMNMTVEEFERANADGAFNWLTTDVAIGGIDKLNEKMQTFNDLLSAASEGSLLTSENLNKIANQFQTLLRGIDETGKYTTDLSSDNILDNIIRMMTDENSLREIYSGLFSGSVAKDSEIWNNFMTLGKGSEIANSNLSDEIKERIKKAGSYSDIVDIFATDEMKEYNDAFKEYVTSMYPITDLLDTQAKILEEYGKYTLETEISNLESVRDSLDDVNKQREKELELIKAKEALENASKEKKRVYRAGVGFVYTTDQEAIKSAQDKVDELERQRDKDNIQYQIDSLQQQKEILENIENNKQLESLINTAEKILGSEGSNSGIAGIITAVNSITSDDFTNKIKEQVKAGITESIQKTNEEAKQKIFKSAKSAKEDLENFYNQEFENSGLTGAQIAQNVSSPFYEAAKKREGELLDNLTSQKSSYVEAGGNLSDLGYNSSDTPIGPTPEGGNLASGEDVEKPIFNKENTSVLKLNYRKKIGAFQIGDMFNWEDDNEQFNIGSAKNIKYAKQNSDGSFDSFKKIDDPENKTLKQAIDEISGPAVIMNNHGLAEYIMYKGMDGKTYKLTGYNIASHSWSSKPGFAAWYSDLWQLPIGTNPRAIDDVVSGKKHNSGTLSAPGGRSLINENGLESIITPSGTITSLPAKSGIIPADLTRNLWALGEVAPNLIARLGGNSLQTNNSNSSTDNSINIQNLDATFNTQSDFDGRRFLTDLRNQVILTANNH